METLFKVLKKGFKKSKAILGSFKTIQRRSAVVRSIGSACKWIPVRRLTISWRNQFIEMEMDFEELRTIVFKLESETQDLRAEVAKLYMVQVQESKLASNVGQCCKEVEFQEDSVVKSQTKVLAPPFQPPPAPPLPPSPSKSTRCLVLKVKPKTEWERDNSFLEELSKRPPKLRHVELSPGGRPKRVRRSIVPNDPTGLTSVLKKRYYALHNSPCLSIDLCKTSPIPPSF